ncbi:hypothetical protein DFH07DRAFT_86837 [Mycena maculata]|uniref:DNA (cytosine-5-)-methyltransferase n=1 Tax=Mycena maculata TaxID=230809 RepID=A0AAD7NUK8_9AGAR|nr:hypothetical protein DFH07DRAFT_86837 [Mycena maculata]
MWDEPLCTVRTQPGSRWQCVHPDGDRMLTLAGEIRDQYRQVGNAVPPLLAEAWAWELRLAILSDYPALRDRFEEVQLGENGQTANVRYKRKAHEMDDTSEEESGKEKRLREA